MAQQYPSRTTHPADGAVGGDARSRVLRWAAGAALLGALLMYNSVDSAGSVPPNTTAGVQAAAPDMQPGVTPPPHSDAVALPAAQPTRLTIGAIGVNAPFTPLTLDPASGTLNPPPEDNNNLAGWYADGPTPGERGNAIVAGHVDTRTGPAVFFLLGLLKPGSTADITRVDGTVATFKVDSVQTFSKDAFPDQRVYGDTPDAELRIITCGGAYDHKKKDYTANVVVFAHLQSSRKA